MRLNDFVQTVPGREPGAWRIVNTALASAGLCSHLRKSVEKNLKERALFWG